MRKPSWGAILHVDIILVTHILVNSTRGPTFGHIQRCALLKDVDENQVRSSIFSKAAIVENSGGTDTQLGNF